MRTPTYVAYVELLTRPIMPPLRYMSIFVAGWSYAEDVACGRYVRAGVLLAGRRWTCRRRCRLSNCVAAQGIGGSGASEAGFAAFQFGCRRGVQWRSGVGSRIDRVDSEPSPVPPAPRRSGRIRSPGDERVSPAAPRRARRTVHGARPELLRLIFAGLFRSSNSSECHRKGSG